MRPTLLAVILSLTIVASVVAQTRPARANGRGLEQLRTALQSLGLAPDQQQKVRELLNDARGKLQALRGEGGREAMIERAQPIVAELRERLRETLTPEQQQLLRDALGESVAPPKLPASAPQISAPTEVGQGLLPIGAAAPDFTLPRADGPNVTLAQHKGKLVLILFAAYSSPTFRQHAPQLEQLKKELGNKLVELVIYTREPHASGEWDVERNQDDGVAIKQAQTVADRTAAAKQMQAALRLSLPIVLDGLDNPTAAAYGAASDTAYLVGRDGTVQFRQKWFDPYAVRRAVDAALANSKP